MTAPPVPDSPTDFFHETSAAALARLDVATGTMMGFPCLRVTGTFSASDDRHTSDVIVKLPRVRQQAAMSFRRHEHPESRIQAESYEKLTATVVIEPWPS